MKFFFALAVAAVMCGCSQPSTDTGAGSSAANSTTTTTGTTPPATDTTPPPTPTSAPYTPPESRKPKDGEEVAVLDTSMGQIVLMFFPDKAPNHVKNFLKLAKKGFYDGTKFHRVMPGFMIQGGDPNTKTDNKASWGGGGPGYTLKGEMNDVQHKRGILSMARTGDPDGAGSQFFIVVADSLFLNPTRDSSGHLVPGREGYTVFGQVLSGQDVADKIVAVQTVGGQGPDQNMPLDPPVLKSVKIVKWPVK